MVIAIINGGFANQLYKYACAYSTAKKYNKKLVIVVQTTDAATDPFQLGEFKLEYTELYITESYIEVFLLFEEWKKKYRLKEINEKDYLSVMCVELFEQYEGIILYGTYQSSIFFRDYIGDLRNIFYFQSETFFLKKFKEEIAGKQSVAIHVRRGDFLTYEGLCKGMEFYKAAMCLMEDILGYGEAEYYIFSDDREFVRAYFGENQRIHYVSTYGDYREAVEEFLAISLCNHRILTEGSSFSRMADALHNDSGSYAIYELNGFETMVYERENMVYLNCEMIEKLVSYYAPLFDRDIYHQGMITTTEMQNLKLSDLMHICIDARGIGVENEIAFRIKKIELLNENNLYGEALIQGRKLWELANGTEYEAQMHEVYWRCLYEYGYRTESIIEAIFLKDIHMNPTEYYDLEEVKRLNYLTKVDKDMEIVFVPSRRFNPHIFEDMIHTGCLLKRIGYQVTFMFRELKHGMLYCQPYNLTLRNSLTYVDVMGHNTGCSIINLTEKEKQYGSIKNFFDEYFKDSKKIFLFAKQIDIINAKIKCENSEKMTTIYWDYSNLTDAGNYEEIQVQSAKSQNVTRDEMQECYLKADYSISFNRTIQSGKPILRLENDTKGIFIPRCEKRIADYYRINSTIFENTFSIIENIIGCMEML
ncbi:MAG: alpha-1,2-fucosyltransferase [Lachnospiraceae bacterium]|nr:alpha-1,2-fucosyltransferase [Lachnospiraceae bacterium]